MASIHLSKIIRDARCKKPMPRVVHIEELYPNARKKYLPHCTILHFCAQETGCCRQENEICAPKAIEPVTLYFWVVELTEFGRRKGVEKLTFLNHTECECLMPAANETRNDLNPGHLLVESNNERTSRRHAFVMRDSNSSNLKQVHLYSFRGKNLYNFNVYHIPMNFPIVIY